VQDVGVVAQQKVSNCGNQAFLVGTGNQQDSGVRLGHGGTWGGDGILAQS